MIGVRKTYWIDARIILFSMDHVLNNVNIPNPGPANMI